MSIDTLLDRIYPLSAPSKSRLIAQMQEIELPKGHILLRADRVETQLYFIKTGIVRAYWNNDGQEITFWFGQQGDPVISMKSYVAGQKGYEDIELLENCSLYQLNTLALEQLYQSDVEIANWGRKLAETELVKTEERLLSRQFRTAKQRYTELLTQQPELLQRVQLGHIASYLGITQVSLSRIRAER